MEKILKVSKICNQFYQSLNSSNFYDFKNIKNKEKDNNVDSFQLILDKELKKMR